MATPGIVATAGSRGALADALAAGCGARGGAPAPPHPVTAVVTAIAATAAIEPACATRNTILAWYHEVLPSAASPGFLVGASVAAAVAVAACGAAQEPGSLTGASDAPPRAPAASPSRSAAHTPVRWEPFAQVEAWPPLGPFVSRGHAGGGLEATVRVSPAARPAYEQLVRSSVLPVDTVIAESLARPGGGDPVAIYTMHKTADGRWTFLVVTPTGFVDESVEIRLCERCHAEAPADQLFGLPRP